MPLLNGEVFNRKQPPDDLDPKEEVFMSPVTLEIFRDYDEYFERTILVNSTTWQCSVCGRGPFTFVDATSCEEADRRELNAYSSPLAAAILYVIQKSKRRRLPELVELLCSLVSTRFFIGEPVSCLLPNTSVPSDGIVTQVIWSPSGSTTTPIKNPERDDTASNVSGCARFAHFDPTDFLYRVSTQLSVISTESTLISGSLVPFTKLKRKETYALSRDRIRFFIRFTCELKDGYFVPKISMMREYNIYPEGHLQWKDLFLLPEPDWEHLTKTPDPTTVRRNQPSVRAPATTRTLVPAPARILHDQSLYPLHANDMRSYRVIDTFMDGRVGVVSEHNYHWSRRRWRPILPAAYGNQPPHVNHIRKQPLGDRIQSCSDNSGRIFVDPFSVRSSIRDVVAPAVPARPEHSDGYDRYELEREWCSVKRRDDLELPDLVPLPEFPEFTSRIPPEDLGAAFQLFEFYHVYAERFDLFIPRDPSQSPNSPLSWSVLESALVDQDPSGPLADFFISLLCAIRRFEATTTNKVITPSMIAATHAAASAVAAAEFGYNASCFSVGHSSDYSVLYEELATGPMGSEFYRVLRNAASATRFNELVGIPCPATSHAAGKAAVMVTLNEDSGELVNKCEQPSFSSGRIYNARAATTATLAGATALCPLDRSGLTKTLEIYFSSAAAKIGLWRSQIWGGARPLDDPAVLFARDYPSLLNKLNSVSVYELSTHEKLLLLTCLMDQLLLYPQFRERYEENFDRQRLLQSHLRTIRNEKLQSLQSNSDNTTDLTNNTLLKSQPLQDTTFSGTNVANQTKSNSSARCADRVNTASNPSILKNNPEVSSHDAPHDPDQSNVGRSSVPSQSKPNNWSTDERKLCSAIYETCRGSSMLSLGQDRFGRRYWLLLSFPCILIEDTSSSSDPSSLKPVIVHRQISSFHPDLAENMGLNSTSAAGLKLRNALANISDHEAVDRSALTYRLASKPIKRSDGLPLTYDQLQMLVKPERPRPHEIEQHNASPAVMQAQRLLSHRLAHPNQPVWRILRASSIPYSTSMEDDRSQTPSTDHTQAVQLNNLAKPSDALEETSVCTHANSGCHGVVGSSEPLTDLTSISSLPTSTDPRRQSTWVLDCLEASLNPRGTREYRLRKSIAQLRPLLIDVVSTCDTLSEASIQPSSHDQPSMPTSPESTLLSWLEIALRRLASRLRMSHCLRSILFPTTTVKTEEYSNGSSNETCTQFPNKSSQQPPSHLPHCTQPNTRLRRLANTLLALGLALGSDTIAGPISDESKTLRGTGVSQPPSLGDDAGQATVKSDTSYTRTTGWQRWCSHVQSASSPSELHLLARALERGIRRAIVGGRGVPSAVRLNASKHRLPKIRCTACNMPPDPSSLHPQSSNPTNPHLQYTSHTGAYVTLSTCAGCFAPFHLDCLMDSRSRVQLHALRHSPTSRKQNATTPRMATDVRMSGCCGFLSPLCSVTAARMETACGSLYLCNACLYAAGHTRSHCSTPQDADANSLTGEEDWDTDSDITEKPEEIDGLHVLETKQETSEFIEEPPLESSLRPKRTRLMCPRRFYDDDATQFLSTRPSSCSQPSCGGSGSTHSDTSSSSLHSYRTSHARRSRDRGRVKGRARTSQLSPLKGNLNVKDGSRSKGGPRYRGFSFCTTRQSAASAVQSCSTRVNAATSTSGELNPSVAESDRATVTTVPCPHSEGDSDDHETVENCQLSDWESDILKFPDIGRLKKASVILAPCDIVDTTFNVVHRELRPRTEHVSAKNTDSPSTLTKASVERLFSELCNLSFARPLLRCGLGRSATTTETDDACPSASDLSSNVTTRRSSRRTTQSDQLYAWDLTGLQELLLRGRLPGGPEQAVEQLRLLLAHWMRTNRPGSRLYECAAHLSTELNNKLSELSH